MTKPLKITSSHRPAVVPDADLGAALDIIVAFAAGTLPGLRPVARAERKKKAGGEE